VTIEPPTKALINEPVRTLAGEVVLGATVRARDFGTGGRSRSVAINMRSVPRVPPDREKALHFLLNEVEVAGWGRRRRRREQLRMFITLKWIWDARQDLAREE